MSNTIFNDKVVKGDTMLVGDNAPESNHKLVELFQKCLELIKDPSVIESYDQNTIFEYIASISQLITSNTTSTEPRSKSPNPDGLTFEFEKLS